MGMSVAGQELLDTQRRLAKIRSDEHDVPEPVRDQLDPAKNKCPEEDVAELAVILDESEEIVPLHVDHLSRLTDPEADERLTSREHADLSREPARPQNRDDLLAILRPPNELDRPRRNDEERLGLMSRRHQDLPARYRTGMPMLGDARDLLRRQRRKHLYGRRGHRDRKSTRLNSSHVEISYAVF